MNGTYQRPEKLYDDDFIAMEYELMFFNFLIPAFEKYPNMFNDWSPKKLRDRILLDITVNRHLFYEHPAMLKAMYFNDPENLPEDFAQVISEYDSY